MVNAVRYEATNLVILLFGGYLKSPMTTWLNLTCDIPLEEVSYGRETPH